jgi:hypothetical protein
MYFHFDPLSPYCTRVTHQGYPLHTFDGPLMGLIESGGFKEGVAGIDCAGFVAAASDTYYCIRRIALKPGCGRIKGTKV